MFDPLILTFFFLGALLGSFANVIILRLPKGESIVTPRSYCYGCKRTVSWKDNIPIFSWLLLRGRCRHCGAKFSVRYMIVELLMGCLFAATYYSQGLTPTLIEYLIFVFGLVTVTFIDLDHMILPDSFTLSGIVIGLIGGLLNPDRSFMDAFFGVLMGGGFLWAIAYAYWLLTKREGMGGGDIKLLGWIGAVLGWKAIPFVIMASSLIGSVVGLIVAVRSKDGLKAAIPFGPYLALGAILYFLGGEFLGDMYLRIFMPFLFE